MLPKAETVRPIQPRIPPSAVLRPLAIFGVVFGALSTIADPDLWGHLRFGLDALASGELTPSDIYSFTSDRAWVNHEWMFEVLLAFAYTAGGPTGLMLLKVMLASAPAVLTWFFLRSTQFAWKWLGVALVSWGTLALSFTLRPQLVTGIALVVVGRIITSDSRRALWWLPLLFAAWANLHGGWIVGGSLILVWCAAAWAQRTPLRWHFLLTGFVSLAVTLLNPHGIDLWTFLAETVRLNRQDISEWRPIWHAGPGFSIMWAITVGIVAMSWRRWGRPPAAVLVALLGFAYASAQVNRLVPLFAVVAVTLLCRHWPVERTVSQEQKGRAIFDAAVVAVGLAIAFWLGGVQRCIVLDHDAAPDTVAAESLRGLQGKLVTHFNWGEYALWHFGPALRVSIDGRRETVYSSATIEEQQDIPDGTDRGLRALERLQPDYIWLPSNATMTGEWLTNHGYRVDVRTEQSYVAVRGDLAPLSAWTGTPSGCFPGP